MLVESTIEDGAGIIRLNRPEKRNSLTHAMVDQFDAMIDEFEARAVPVVIIEGAPPVFCAGNDLVEARSRVEPAAADRLLATLMTRPFFFIAAVGGAALGAGMAIAAVCPVVVASEEAWFSLPEVDIGLFPTGVTMYLEDLIGPRLAMTLGLSKDRLDAHGAASVGLVTQVVAAGGERTAAKEWAARLLAVPQVTDTGRKAWQARFASPAYHARAAVLTDLLRAQDLT